MSSRESRDVPFNYLFGNHARNSYSPVRQWQDRLVGRFLTKMNKNSFYLRNALRYRWKLSGELSVSKLGRGFYLIKFESSNEMINVLRQGTRVICGDTFLIQIYTFSVLPENYEINSEVFELTVHKLYP